MQYGKHEGCIDGKDWIAVQELLKSNESKRYRKPSKNCALLSGILRCGQCGSYMRAKIHTGRFNEKGEEIFYYMCELKEKSKKHKCQNKNVNGNELDKLLMEKVKEFVTPDNKIMQELEKISTTSVNIYENSDELNNLKLQYDKNKKEMDNLIKRIKYVDIEIIDDINKEIKVLKRKNNEIEKRISELNERNSIDAVFPQKEVAKIVIEIIKNHFDKFYDLDIIERRNILKMIINQVTANGDDIEVDLLNTGDGSIFNSELLPRGAHSK